MKYDAMNMVGEHKTVYWLCILTLTTGFIIVRIVLAPSTFPTTVDTAAAILWGVLALVPLFSEISLGGLTVKRQVEAMKTEMKDELRTQFQSVRHDLNMALQVNSSQNQQFSFNFAPPDATLRERLAKQDDILPSTKATPSDLIESPPQEAHLFFSVRYALDREIDRLYRADTPRRAPIGRALSALVDDNTISPDLSAMTRELYAVCSPAIHGAKPTDDQIHYVTNFAPRVLAALREIRPIREPH